MYVLALVLALASPAATASPQPAALAPNAFPVKPVLWQGVTLGENIEAVRARLGKPEFNRKVILGSMLVEYPIHGGEGTLLLETTDKQVTQIRVEAAAPKELALPIGDPYGVNLGDSLTRLMVIRGNPTRSYDDAPDESTSTYGGWNENRWVYSIHGGTIVAITLVAPRLPPPPSGPAHPGLVLHGTPPPKHAVLKGAPATTSSPTASTAANAPPTPTPGIALSTPTPKPTAAPAGAVIVSSAAATVATPTMVPLPTATPSSAPSPSVVASASPSPIAVAPAGVPTPSAAPNAIASPNVANPAVVTPNPNASLAPDGSSPETAIPVRAPDMGTGFDYMYKFIESIACDGGQYRVTGQDLFSQSRRNYAKVTAECSTTHERRAFFFDITYIFTRSER